MSFDFSSTYYDTKIGGQANNPAAFKADGPRRCLHLASMPVSPKSRSESRRPPRMAENVHYKGGRREGVEKVFFYLSPKAGGGDKKFG